jgi:hypothetical protein
MVNAPGQNRQWLGSLQVQFLATAKLDLSSRFGETTVRASGLLAAGLLLAVGCSRPPADAKRPATQRERDSVIGASKLPGATGVRGALRLSDSADARNARIDSAGN